MKTIHWTAERPFEDDDQRMTATLHDDGAVTFHDHSRRVAGLVGFADEFTPEKVMILYDRGAYASPLRADQDAMLFLSGVNSVWLDPDEPAEPTAWESWCALYEESGTPEEVLASLRATLAHYTQNDAVYDDTHALTERIEAVRGFIETPDSATVYDVVLTYNTIADSPHEALALALEAVATRAGYAEVFVGDHVVVDGDLSEFKFED